MPVNDYEDIIQAAAHEWNVDPILIKAVMHQESGGNRTKNGKPITSSAGAGGLMQIMPRTAKDLGVVDVHDPEQAIWGGTKYLSQMLDRFQDPKLAVAAYNAGPGNIEAGRFPAETRAYVPAVASHYQMFSKSGGVAARAGGTDVAGPGAKSVDALPSDDDFLKQTGAGRQAETSLQADDEFLKATGAKVSGSAPITQVTPPTPDFIPGVIRHEYDNPIGTLPTISAIPPIDAGAAGRTTRGVIGNALSSVGREARNILSETGADASTLGRDIVRGTMEGFGSGPLGLSDQSANALRSAGPFPDLAEGVVRPVTAAADLFLRGASGALRGAQEGVMSLGRMTGQEVAARDLAAMPEAFAGMVSGGGARGNPLRGEPAAVNEAGLARRAVTEAVPSAERQIAKISETPIVTSKPFMPPKTSAEAKEVASAYYKKADEVGGHLVPEFTNRFLDEAQKIAPQTAEGQTIAGENAVTKLVERAQALRDKPITLKGAQEIDESLGNLIDKEYSVKGLSKEGTHLLDLQSTFRDMVQNANEADAAGGVEGFSALKSGRKAWSQAMKMNDLERIVNRAELTDNPATSIKSGIRVLLSNPKRVRGYSAQEVAALKQASERGTLGSALHVFGSRLVPLVAGGIGGAGGGLVGALAGAGVAHGAATLMRNAATGLQTKRMGNALSTLGSSVPPPP